MVSEEPIIGRATNEKKGFILRYKSVIGFVINHTYFVKNTLEYVFNKGRKTLFCIPCLL
jgi:hypothetical protein